MHDSVVAIRNLSVTFRLGERRVRAVRGIDLDLVRGRIHALVGESGSGKSVTARSILGLLPRDRAEVAADSFTVNGREVLTLDEAAFRDIRGSVVSMIFQEPAKHLNPSIRIGRQICEMIRVHERVTRGEARAKAVRLIELVGLATSGGGSRRVLESYPHELSGGMNQRALIALALSCDPELLIADEPTTALDVTVGRQILNLLRRINSEFGMAVLFISHDLAHVHDICDEISIMYAGKIVETGPRDPVFGEPLHPYTKLLLASVPDPTRRGERLAAIRGHVPDAEALPTGCAFHPRCPRAEAVCRDRVPELRLSGPDRRVACHLVGSPAKPETAV
jgi:peptide/nickel transport system ATP-binding protein